MQERVTKSDIGSREEFAKALVFEEEKNKQIKKWVLEDSRLDVLMEHVLGYEMTDLWAYMGEYQVKNKISLILVFRGAGKSTTCTIAYAVMRILQNPNVRVLIIGQTDSQAQSWLREIKNNLVHPKLVEIFGKQIGDKIWSAHEIEVCTKTSNWKEPTVFVCGSESANVVGRHFDIALIDDIVSEGNSKTEIQREKLRIFYYKNIVPTLMPDAEKHIVGTRYHPDDLYGHMMDHEFLGKTLTIPALIEDGDGFLTSTFPEKISTEALLAKREEMGTIIFNSQYQMDVSTMGGDFIKPDWINWYDEPPPGLFVYSGVDLAISLNDDADKFAICTIGVDMAGKIFVLDAYTQRLSFKKQQDKIIDTFHAYKVLSVGIESNAYQQAQAQSTTENTGGVVRVKKIFTKESKQLRMWRLSAKFESGMIYLKKEQQELYSQAVGFPKYRYKDLLDALDLAVTNSTTGVRRQRKRTLGVIGHERK